MLWVNNKHELLFRQEMKIQKRRNLLIFSSRFITSKSLSFSSFSGNTNTLSIPILNLEHELSSIMPAVSNQILIVCAHIFTFFRNAITLVYYGLTFYLPSLGANPYLSLILSGLIEVKRAHNIF